MPRIPFTISKNPDNRLPFRRTAAVLALGIVACLPPRNSAAEDLAPARGLRVVVSYYPLYVFTLNLSDGIPGPRVSILLPPTGGCAHGLSLRPGQVIAMDRAEVIVETGLGLEPFLDDPELLPPGRCVRIDSAADIPDSGLIAQAHHHEHAEGPEDDDSEAGAAAGHRHEPEAFNGHAWSDPVLAARMVRTIAKGMAGVDQGNADIYLGNARAYAARLEELGREYETLGARLKGKRVVVSHMTLLYLARRMGLEVVASLRDEDEKEPGPRTLGTLIDQLKADGVDAILVDPQGGGRLAELVGKAVGCANLIEIDPAASGPMEKGAYEAIMRGNLDRLKAWADIAGREQAAAGGYAANRRDANVPAGIENSEGNPS